MMSGSASREPSTNRLAPGNNRANVRGNSPKRPIGSGKSSVDTSKMTAKQSEDYWIHRDKLAKIESQELQQWGIQLPATKQRKGAGSRAGSRASSRHRQRADEYMDVSDPEADREREYGQRSNANTPDGKMYLSNESDTAEDEYGRPLQYTTEPEELGHPSDHDNGDHNDEYGDVEDDDRYPNGLSSFNEYNRGISTPTGQDYVSLPLSAPGSGPTSPSGNGARKGSSKIPVPSLSRLPVPATASLNDRPNTSSRVRANTTSSTDALTGRTRSRHNSSNQRVNTAESNTSVSASGGSRGSNSTSTSPEPPKEANGKASRGRNGRPLSTGSVPPKVQQQLKQASANARANRDSNSRSSGGGGASARRPQTKTKRRPSTTRAQPNKDREPMGDPPWLASSFRPDPRLPPEQQILPTHAKKMLQEQWEKEGKTGLLYDKSFAPLAIADDYLNYRPPAHENQEDNGTKDDDRENGDGHSRYDADRNEQRHYTPEPALESPRMLSPPIRTPTGSIHEMDPQFPSPAAKRPSVRRSGSSYRTMPPIQRTHSASPSSRGAGSPLAQPPMPQSALGKTSMAGNVIQQKDAEKVADESGKKKKEAGCGCCIIM